MRAQRVVHRLVWVCVFSIALLTPQTSRPVYACSCAPPPSVADAVDQATAVFTGTVIAIDQDITIPPRRTWLLTPSYPFVRVEEQSGVFAGPSRIDFEGVEVWKGQAHQRVTLVSWEQDGGGCGYSFTAGQRYVVYARRTAQGLENSYCGRTARVQQAQADLWVLGGASAARQAAQPPAQPSALESILAGVGALGLLILVAYLGYRQWWKRIQQP